MNPETCAGTRCLLLGDAERVLVSRRRVRGAPKASRSRTGGHSPPSSRRDRNGLARCSGCGMGFDSSGEPSNDEAVTLPACSAKRRCVTRRPVTRWLAPLTNEALTSRCWSGPRSSLSQTSALGGTRTPNLLIRSQMLYPLSYERRCDEQSTTLQPATEPSSVLRALSGTI